MTGRESLLKDFPRWKCPCPLRTRMEYAENEADRAWAVLDWLAENMPRALELCPYKAPRTHGCPSRHGCGCPEGDCVRGRTES